MSTNVDRRGALSLPPAPESTPISIRVARQGSRVESRRACLADVSPTYPEPASPLLLVLAIVGGSYAVLFFAAIVAQAPVRLVDIKYLGLDFTDFWTAANDVLAGRDPYLRSRFVTPPLSWVPFLPFALFARPQAALAFLCVNAASLVVGIAALVRHYRLRSPLVLVVALICALSPSTLMLLDRGNLDGLVFLPLCLFIALRHDRVAGPLALAMATCLKLYPGVYILALVAQRRTTAALIAAAAVLAAIVLLPADDLAFLHSQVVRAGVMRIDENLSGLALFWFFDEMLRGSGTTGISAHPALLAGTLLYVGALSTCLWWDTKLIGRVRHPDLRLMLASYAGFCVSMPSLVYLYSGVCLFIPLVALGQQGLSVSPARLKGFAVALGLSMLPARSLELTIGASWAGLLNLLPVLGSSLLLIQAVGLRIDLRNVTLLGAENASHNELPRRA